jgi:hypothetical protein
MCGVVRRCVISAWSYCSLAFIGRLRTSFNPCQGEWSGHHTICHIHTAAQAQHSTLLPATSHCGLYLLCVRLSLFPLPLSVLCLFQLNAAYVFWQCWLNLLVVNTFWAIQLLTSSPLNDQHVTTSPSSSSSPSSSPVPPSVDPSPPPPVLLSSSIDRSLADHSLLFFLVSNLGTGLVNLVVDTLHCSTANSVILLLLYLHSAVLVVTLYGQWRRTRRRDRSTDTK